MDLMLFRKKWLVPLFFFEVYLSVTVALFFFGPWPWEIDRPILLISYLAAAQLFIAIGYLLAWRRVLGQHQTTEGSAEHLSYGISFLKRSLLISCILIIPTALSRTGNFFPNIFEGLSDAGAVYNRNFERLQDGNPFVAVEYLRMLFAPFLIAIFPLTVVYWSQLSLRFKLLSSVVIFFNLSLYLATGTNKGMADFVVSLPWLIFLGVSTGLLRLQIQRRWIVVIVAALFIAFLQFFGMGQAEREGGVGELGVFNTGSGLVEASRDNFLSLLLSDGQRIIFESLARYVGQGYYALSMSLGLEHSSTFGFGHSMFLARNADAIFNTDYFTAGSLPGLLELKYEWGMFTLWHSIYPWLASDFGFIGTLFVMAAFGYLLGLSWGFSLLTASHQWIVLFYLLLILFFYIPANNQIFQAGETCMAFFFLLLAILVGKKRTGLNDKSGDLELRPDSPSDAQIQR
ncbi:hypothetical protein [Polaromonas sp.]|uniref:hypothetical protein n=1 Tax=Polaromonas sp. TaxID=1869339 RepID=UPI00286C88F2|nr:hypothetical protein [Polaromonas sp.]